MKITWSLNTIGRLFTSLCAGVRCATARFCEGDYYYDFGGDVVCVECVTGYVRLNYEKKAEVK